MLRMVVDQGDQFAGCCRLKTSPLERELVDYFPINFSFSFSVRLASKAGLGQLDKAEGRRDELDSFGK